MAINSIVEHIDNEDWPLGEEIPPYLLVAQLSAVATRAEEVLRQ